MLKSWLKLMRVLGVEEIDGQFNHSDCTKANTFNDFFSSVFVDEDRNTVPTFATSRDDLPSLSSVEATKAIVFEKLQSLKCDELSGPDG